MEIKDNAPRRLPSGVRLIETRYGGGYLRSTELAALSGAALEQHRRAAKAIRLGDAAGAEEGMRHHLATVCDVQLLNWQPELQGFQLELSTVARPESVYASVLRCSAEEGGSCEK